MDRRRFLRNGVALGTGSLLAATATAGCLEGRATEGDWDVGMTATAFDPQTVAVPVDATVAWKNTSTRNHTVTAYDDGIPDGADFFSTGDFTAEAAARDGFIDGEGVIRPEETFEHTFAVPGTYSYLCIPHERAGMVGTVEVGDGGSES